MSNFKFSGLQTVSYGKGIKPRERRIERKFSCDGNTYFINALIEKTRDIVCSSDITEIRLNGVIHQIESNGKISTSQMVNITI